MHGQLSQKPLKVQTKQLKIAGEVNIGFSNMKHTNKNIFQGILGQRPEQDHVNLNV